MTWILLMDEMPDIGERVIIDTGTLIIGARLSMYLNSSNLYWRTDLDNSVAFNETIKFSRI